MIGARGGLVGGLVGGVVGELVGGLVEGVEGWWKAAGGRLLVEECCKGGAGTGWNGGAGKKVALVTGR